VYHRTEQGDNNQVCNSQLSFVFVSIPSNNLLGYYQAVPTGTPYALNLQTEWAMRLKLLMRLSISFFVLTLSLLAGCGARSNLGQVEGGIKTEGREVAIGESFKLVRDEKVRVKDTPLTIELKGVRNTWYVDGKSDTVDADIIIALNEKEQRKWIDLGEKVTAGDYVVELTGANPFGENDCELIVTRR
jgi:hypothetical protein